jgi:hypothetical protein
LRTRKGKIAETEDDVEVSDTAGRFNDDEARCEEGKWSSKLTHELGLALINRMGGAEPNCVIPAEAEVWRLHQDFVQARRIGRRAWSSKIAGEQCRAALNNGIQKQRHRRGSVLQLKVPGACRVRQAKE